MLMVVETIKNILMLFVSATTSISFIPQILQLYRTKHSEDISISSWVLWVSSSTSFLIFSFLEGGFGLIFSSLVEFILTALVLILTIKYRNNKRPK